MSIIEGKERNPVRLSSSLFCHEYGPGCRHVVKPPTISPSSFLAGDLGLYLRVSFLNDLYADMRQTIQYLFFHASPGDVIRAPRKKSILRNRKCVEHLIRPTL